jgi:hypothetical protein
MQLTKADLEVYAALIAIDKEDAIRAAMHDPRGETDSSFWCDTWLELRFKDPTINDYRSKQFNKSAVKLIQCGLVIMEIKTYRAEPVHYYHSADITTIVRTKYETIK